MECVPGRVRDLGRDRERVIAVGVGVVVGEVVDQLLDAHGVLGRPLPLVDEAPHVAVRGAVHVDGECRQRVRRHAEEDVLDDGVVGLGVEVRIVAPRQVVASADRIDDGHPALSELGVERRRGLLSRRHGDGWQLHLVLLTLGRRAV